MVVQAVIFFSIVLFTVTVVHYYLWRRLVRNTTRPGRARRIGTWVVLGLVALLIATLIGSRAFPRPVALVLAWPGYLWVAVMFYLLVGLLALEVPALVLKLVWRRQAAVPAPVPALVGAPADPPEPPPAPVVGAPADLQSRRLFLGRAVALTAGVAAVGLVGTGVRTALGDPRVTELTIELPRLHRGGGWRIALVSDIHLGPLTGFDRTRRIVDMITGL